MVDTVDAKTRSYIMSRIKSKNTIGELLLKDMLTRAGVHVTSHPPLPGKPDLAVLGRPIAIFMDGCFWHGCPRHFKLPKTNRKFWRDKFKANKERDIRVDDELMRLRWTPLRLWECEVKRAPAYCVSRVQYLMSLYG